MKGLRFLDLDLMFQRTASGYRAQVDSPAGQATIEFALPFSDLEIENFLLRFGRPRQPMRRFGNTQIEAARAFGGRLFAAVFNGEARSCLRSSIDDADRLDAGLRIRLRLADAPELNDLPWEFLLHPELDRFLALSAETPIVRYLDLPERVRPLAVKPPLKVLTVISSPTDYTPLDVETEWRKLQEALAEVQERGLLILNRLESPTLPHLQRWLRWESCHILHFIGHGGFNTQTEDGLLLFSDDHGRGRQVTGQTLGTLLHDHRPLRLAVLNACEGARTSRTDPFAGVAQSLVQQGIPAVVAMQFEISDKAATTFAYELYTAVVDGYPVDAALGEARKALFFAGHELEWGTPVLYMRSPDGRIFDIELAAASAIVVKTRDDSRVAKPTPTESRPTPVEGKAAPAAPKVPSPEAATKASQVELTPAAAMSTDKEEPSAAKPAPFEVKPVLAAPKPPPSEATVKAPVVLKVPSLERPPSAVPMEVPAQTKMPLVQHAPTEAKAGKAPHLADSQVQGRPRRGPRILAWLGLIALLGIAIFIAVRLLSGSGEIGAQIPAPGPPASMIPEPVIKRKAGIYLTQQVRAGEKPREDMLKVVAGGLRDSNETPALNDALSENICFTANLEPGHMLVWDDLSRCK